MSTVAFDTYKAAISEGLATTGDIQSLKGSIQSSRSELKGDIQSLRSELKDDIQRLEGKIQGLAEKIQTIESRLTVRLYSALALAVALIKALDYIFLL